jgi:hypothetical protein
MSFGNTTGSHAKSRKIEISDHYHFSSVAGVVQICTLLPLFPACQSRGKNAMTKRTLLGVALIGLIEGMAGCESRATPSAPSSVPPPTVMPGPSDQVVVFADPHSSFSTSDLHDADEQVIRFSVASELIWMADGTRLLGYGVAGNSISVPACACSLVVRFGTRDGERRAYLTADYIHDNPGTLIGLSISGGALAITRTTVFAPGTYTQSGVITEMSESRPIPVEGAGVWRLDEEQSGCQVATTDKDGLYELKGLYDGEREVSVIKDGYDTVRGSVLINGDTRFDRQIVKR